MAKILDGLRYTQTHEWLKPEQNDIFLVGITDYAQAQLGDVVFVDFPDSLPVQVAAGVELLVLESVKAAVDVYAVLTGEIIEVNQALLDDPSLINQDPYGRGWLYRIHSQDQHTLQALLDAKSYQAHH